MAKKKLSPDMIAFMRELILQEKTKVAQDPDIKSRPGTQPKKYHKGLSKSTKAARDAHFKKNDDYGPAPGDKGAKTKKSKHTKKFEKMFGESINEMPAGRSEKDTGKFNDLPKALRDKMIARYGEPEFDGKHDFISNDGDTLFQAYEKDDETGSVSHKIIKLPSFQKLYSDWSDIIKDIKTLRKNPDVNQDAKARELFEEMKSMFRSLQRYLREERPEQYELMKMRRSMNEMANEEVINQKLSKLDYKFLNSYFDAEKFSAPNPDDSLRQINNERDWDHWKAGTLEKYGDVDVELNKDEAWFSKFKIIDTKFMKDKKSYTDAKGRALDSWRKTSNYGLDERLEKVAKKILAEKMDYNDPVMIKLRQAQMKKAQMDKEEAELKVKKAALDKKYGSSYMDKLDAEISLKQELQDLQDERAQLMRDMEQEAEPEGGEIADRYGSRLNDIDAKTAEIKKELEDLRAVHFENINEANTPRYPEGELSIKDKIKAIVPLWKQWSSASGRDADAIKDKISRYTSYDNESGGGSYVFDILDNAQSIEDVARIVIKNEKGSITSQQQYTVKLLVPVVYFNVESGELSDNKNEWYTDAELKAGADQTSYTKGSELDDVVFDGDYSQALDFAKRYPNLIKVVKGSLNEEIDGGRLFDYFKSKGYDITERRPDGYPPKEGVEGYMVSRGEGRAPQAVIFQYNKDTNEFTISRMSGYRIDQQAAIKAGMRQAGRSGVAGIDSYMTDGNYTPVDISAQGLKDIVDHVMSGLDREGEAQRDFYKDRGPTSGTVDETLINEFLGGDLEKRNDVLFKKLVPGQGDSEFVEGEMIRAMNRLVYRWYNDGDKFWEGYGTETAGPAHSFLINSYEIPSEERRRFQGILDAVVGKYDDKVYEDMLNKLAEAIISYVESIPEDQYQKLEKGMFEYDSEYEDEEDDDDYDDYYDDYEDEEDDDYYQEGVTEGKEDEALKNKAEKANAPLGALRAIYNKGLAAFKSGHRPGANQHQWAMARVNSVLTGGPARKTDDAQWKQIQKFRKNKKKK